MKEIHGIPKKLIKNAPLFSDVKKHLEKLIEIYKQDNSDTVVIIGQSIISDIEAMKLEEIDYIDTTNYKYKSDQHGGVKRLKDLVSEHLNASI